MDGENLKQLYNLLIDFATLPCDVVHQCESCPIDIYCSMLYNLSRGIKGELTIDEVVDKINADYRNIRWEEGDD